MQNFCIALNIFLIYLLFMRMTVNPVANLLKYLQLGVSEMQIFQMLSKPMTIKQLIKETKMSERMLRTHLDSLVKKQFIKRAVIEGKHLKYVYSANPTEDIISMMKTRINEIEMQRKKMRKDIIHGYEKSIRIKG